MYPKPEYAPMPCYPYHEGSLEPVPALQEYRSDTGNPGRRHGFVLRAALLDDAPGCAAPRGH